MEYAVCMPIGDFIDFVLSMPDMFTMKFPFFAHFNSFICFGGILT